MKFGIACQLFTSAPFVVFIIIHIWLGGGAYAHRVLMLHLQNIPFLTKK